MTTPTRILAIAPYKGLREMILDIASRREDIWVDAYWADMNEVGELLDRLDLSQYDVILSRGGTLMQISNRVLGAIPICEIEVSFFDVLQALQMAISYHGSIAMVGFKSITDKALDVCAIMGYQIPCHIISSGQEVQECLTSLAKENVAVVVGDTITIKTAEAVGLNHILITSGIDSVTKAIGEAIRTNFYLSKIKRELTLHEALCLHLPVGAALFSDEMALVRCWSIPEELQKPLAEALQTVEPSEFDLASPLLVGADSLMIEHKALQSAGKPYHAFYVLSIAPARACAWEVRMEEAGRGGNALDHCLRSNNQAVAKLLMSAHRAARGKEPILIKGEPGSGKSTLAQAIHAQKRNRVLFLLDGAREIAPHEASALERELARYLASNSCTVLLQNIHRWAKQRRDWLLNCLSREPVRCALIIEMDVLPGSEQEDLKTADALFQVLPNCSVLTMVPLRERKEDIMNFASLFLSESFAENGRQAATFLPEVKPLLEGIYWENNIRQLKAFVQHISRQVYGLQIGTKDVESALGMRGFSPLFGVNLYQPLDDIVKDVVQIVLAQEGYNQTKAASRLGIGRSTLWRMLK